MRYKKIFIIHFMCLTLFFNGNEAVTKPRIQKRGVMDNFNDGLKLAGQMFGINTAADVANLVAKAFSSTRNRNRQPDLLSIFQQRKQQEANSGERQSEEYEQQQQQQETQQHNSNEVPPTSPPGKEEVNVDFSATSLVTNILRMIGFDASKLGALAINAIIMIAQAIGNTLMTSPKSQRLVSTIDGGRLYSTKNPSPIDDKPEAFNAQDEHQPRALNDDTPLDWFLRNPNKKMRHLLDEAMNKQLSEKITQMIEKIEDEEGQGACLKLLMCKSSPFIWGMQKSLNERLSGKTDTKSEPPEKSKNAEEKVHENHKLLSTEGFFTHLPSIEEYRQHGETCEKRYAVLCNTTQAYDAFKRDKRV